MNLKIAVLPGDGIGPEVTEQAVKVLDAISQNYNHKFNYSYADVGAIAIDNHNDPLPKSTLDLCKSTDAIYLVPLATLNTIIILRPRCAQSKAY